MKSAAAPKAPPATQWRLQLLVLVSIATASVLGYILYSAVLAAGDLYVYARNDFAAINYEVQAPRSEFRITYEPQSERFLLTALRGGAWPRSWEFVLEDQHASVLGVGPGGSDRSVRLTERGIRLLQTARDEQWIDVRLPQLNPFGDLGAASDASGNPFGRPGSDFEDAVSAWSTPPGLSLVFVENESDYSQRVPARMKTALDNLVRDLVQEGAIGGGESFILGLSKGFPGVTLAMPEETASCWAASYLGGLSRDELCALANAPHAPVADGQAWIYVRLPEQHAYVLDNIDVRIPRDEELASRHAGLVGMIKDPSLRPEESLPHRQLRWRFISDEAGGLELQRLDSTVD